MTTTEEHQPHVEGGGSQLAMSDNPRHFGIEPGDPWPEDVPRGQDDSHWRFEDDPRRARRAELRIAFCWTLTLLASIGLAWVYVAGGQAQVEGVLWAVALLGLGVGFIMWGRDLLPNREIIASRGHHEVTDEGWRNSVAEALSRGVEPIARRPFLFKMLGAVGGAFGLAALFPLASLGPRPHKDLYRTLWGPGVRLTTEDGQPIRPTDLPVNGILTVFPNGNIDDALSPTLLMNVGDAPLKIFPSRVGWNIGGLVAFSKICTHAGCPASLYNTQTHQLVCPCHQSTFDVLEEAKPVFGPASRSLPQLPLAVDSQGYLVSQSDYTQPVGPGFWNRK
ncbi:MAG TPA: Rieske 2Fe-2S domain-containing protein [Acidimicrobiales bacterium]|nr:Rieske 2Fe-2S domain-containing protein [Acidimicrobiales bacterium]